ncbi:hypothetical protein KOSB73_340014 [Klebsiella grimontii]|uniref:Uncharacterized protein n=1 Tax=Klebsiella grimontii TaxID=2058152 RepID=A0A285B8J4_9ENTR|nr:hypothetical protein KOSB73_340014 [Klebsiella grimontii]
MERNAGNICNTKMLMSIFFLALKRYLEKINAVIVTTTKEISMLQVASIKVFLYHFK